jgi:hypothetical protein
MLPPAPPTQQTPPIPPTPPTPQLLVLACRPAGRPAGRLGWARRRRRRAIRGHVRGRQRQISLRGKPAIRRRRRRRPPILRRRRRRKPPLRRRRRWRRKQRRRRRNGKSRGRGGPLVGVCSRGRRSAAAGRRLVAAGAECQNGIRSISYSLNNVNIRHQLGTDLTLTRIHRTGAAARDVTVVTYTPKTTQFTRDFFHGDDLTSSFGLHLPRRFESYLLILPQLLQSHPTATTSLHPSIFNDYLL